MPKIKLVVTELGNGYYASPISEVRLLFQRCEPLIRPDMLKTDSPERLLLAASNFRLRTRHAR